jgi:hypothetical protein
LARVVTIRAAKAIKATTMSTTTSMVADRIPARPARAAAVRTGRAGDVVRADLAGTEAASMTDRHYTM